MSWLVKLHYLSYRLIPGCCRLCGGLSGQPIDICPACVDDLPRIDNPCPRCGLSQSFIQSLSYCAHCITQRMPFDSFLAPFVYQGAVQKLHHRFKFQRDVAAGQLLSSLLLLFIRQNQPMLPDFLVPVPIHWRRRMSRGFNQVDVICETLASELALEFKPALKRVKAGLPQQALNRKARTTNVAGAFQLKVPETSLTGKHLVLVDDVCTTGSTAVSAAGVLLKAGASRVDLWCLARTIQ